MRIRQKLPDGTIKYPSYEDSIVAINEGTLKALQEKSEANEEALVEEARKLVTSKAEKEQADEQQRKYEELKAQFEALQKLQNEQGGVK